MAESGLGARRMLVLHGDDNVAVVLSDVALGEEVADAAGVRVTACGPVPYGHKISLRPIRKGAAVVKYGQPIGHALADISLGEWIHSHNLASDKERGEALPDSSGETGPG